MDINTYEVVKKLIGEIDPVGETHVDDKRYENLKAMTELVDTLLTDIDRVAGNRTRVEFSMKRAGNFARDFFNQIGVKE